MRPHDVGCYSNWVRTLYFHGGEKDLGSFNSVSDCILAAKQQCKGYDLVNVANEVLPNRPTTSCWCQYSRGLDLEDYYDLKADWQACRIRQLFEDDDEEEIYFDSIDEYGDRGGDFDRYDSMCECMANREEY